MNKNVKIEIGAGFPEWPQLMRITEDGKRMFITLNQAGKVVMFDISEPEKPKVLREVINLDRRMFLVQFGDGSTTFLFPDEVSIE